MLVNTKEMLNAANGSNYAIPSFDFIHAQMVRIYTEVAEELKRPCILAMSEALSAELPLEDAYAIGRYYAEKSHYPVALHIDHGKTVSFVKKAIDLGFTSVMIDGSADCYQENVRKTKEIVEYAHARNVTVEAEIGHVGSGINYEDEVGDTSVFTEVEELIRFVQDTGVDSVAVSIGTAHGVYTGTPKINFERLRELKEAVSIPLVLHGGSSSGDANLKTCAEIGISKINIFTDVCQAAALAMGSVEEKNNYRKIMSAADEAIRQVVRHYHHVFNCD